MANPATTALTYNGYINQIATMAVVNTTISNGVVVGVDAAFNTIIPQMLNYAELRIQRDLDILPSQVENDTYNLVANNNILQISVNDFVTIETVGIVANSQTNPLLPVSKQYIQNIYSSSTGSGVPSYFAVYGGDLATYGNTYQNMLLGPWPDQAYPVVITGTIRLQTLYVNATTALANTATTFISTYFPDLLVMASMVYIAGFQRDFSSNSNDPQMGVNYENQYQTLLKGAMAEEYRKKFQASGWSSNSTSPVATPTR